MSSEISPLICEKAPVILAEIKKAKSVLLHCHPSPDPDSVGSALAMKFAVEQLGVKATVFKGDSEIPDAFMHFPGARDIVQKNFFELDLAEFDLFIIQDSGSKEMISRFKPIEFPLPMRTIVIDHHASNQGYGDINLVEPTYPAACQVLHDLFMEWQIKLTPEIAANLFIGMYTDTGGFKYRGTTARTFAVAAELTKIVPSFPKLISDMENSRTPGDLALQALALSNIETFLNGKCGLSIVTLAGLKEKNIPMSDVHAGMISPILQSVKEWSIAGVIIEVAPGNIKMSFRSKDADYDVSKLAVALGGGGHKDAAGAVLMMPLEDAKKLVVQKMEELYNL